MIYPALRSLMFCLPAEASHELAIATLEAYGHFPGRAVPLPGRRVEVLGLSFANPVGLAAGLDKDARALVGLGRLGFGFVEVGTVTPRAQPGNPRPRLFRLTEHQAIINRMGFNSDGVDAMHARLATVRRRGLLPHTHIGVNLGKNKETPLDQAVTDYLIGMRRLHELADYFTLNLSSPNTPGLRQLQQGAQLSALLHRVKQEQGVLAEASGRAVPLLVKVAPDLAREDLLGVAEAVMHHQIDGVIATNTTLARDPVAAHPLAGQTGGLSGEPVRAMALETVRTLREVLPPAVPVIGVGGIGTLDAAREMLDSGANLLQIYTSFIYQGPNLVQKLVSGLR